MDEGYNKKEEEEEEQRPAASQSRVLQLADGQVGETETDELQPEAESKHVSFELPGGSGGSQLTMERQRVQEAQALVKDMIETILPKSENDEAATSTTITQQPMPTSSSQSRDDERLQRILRLLDRYTRNLEAIEEHVRESHLQLDSSTEVQLSQHCELATQTLPLSTLCLDVTSTIRPKSSNSQQQQQQSTQQQQEQQQQQQAIIPPCERRYHTITISTNSSAAFAAPAQPRTLLGRMWRTMGDFAAACCLCLQVNKDCVFCLGFFLAFVISASFLTAFFYRTINLTQPQGVRLAMESPATTPANSNMVTLRFNGGYYYIYNNQRQHFV